MEKIQKLLDDGVVKHDGEQAKLVALIMMRNHDSLVETPSDSVIENVKIGDHSKVLPSFDNTIEQLSNPNNVIIDEVTPLIKVSQMTSSIIVNDVKPPPRGNTKDDYDVIRYRRAIPDISNMLDVLCGSSKTRWAVECALADVATKKWWS